MNILRDVILLPALAAHVSVYIGRLWVTLEPNPLEWGADGRGLYLITVLFVAVLYGMLSGAIQSTKEGSK